MAAFQSGRLRDSLVAKPGEIPVLDGLRGLAILLVLLRHSARPIYEDHGTILAIAGWDVAVPLLNGWMGVDLFFLLSGFLIAHHLMNHWPARLHTGFLLKYLLKRVLRTFPAYYATLLIVVLGVLPFYRPQPPDMGREVVHHLLFLQDYLGSELVPAFWSLGVEEKFYLLCPIVLWWLSRYPRSRQIGILVLLAVLPAMLRALTLAGQGSPIEDYPAFFWTVRSPFHLACDGMWLGVICALTYRWHGTKLATKKTLRKVLLGSGCTVFAVLFGAVAWFDAGHFRSAVAVLFLVPLSLAAIMLSVITGPTILHRILTTGWLRFFATISYSVYLIHLVMVPYALSLIAPLDVFRNNTPLLQFLLFFPVFVIASVLAGLALHISVERPFLLLKNRIRLSRAVVPSNARGSTSLGTAVTLPVASKLRIPQERRQSRGDFA